MTFIPFFITENKNLQKLPYREEVRGFLFRNEISQNAEYFMKTPILIIFFNMLYITKLRELKGFYFAGILMYMGFFKIVFLSFVSKMVFNMEADKDDI